MYEISSDSDDDCYDKFPQKLQQLKNKRALNNLLKVVDNSTDNKDADLNSGSLISNQDSDVIPVHDSNCDDSLTNLIPIEVDTPSIGTSTRRRSKRNNPDSQWSPATPTQNGGKRGRGSGRGRVSRASASSARQPRARSKSRGRGTQNVTRSAPMLPPLITVSPRRNRRTRRGGRQQNYQSPESFITYSVGNTDEYPDASDDQVLFNNKNVKASEPVTIIDLDESLENEELSVKVYWQHSEVFKFNIRRHQKLTQIFDFFVNKQGVSRDHLLFTYNNKRTNKILRPEDTPDSIDYNIAKFIEGGIINKQFTLNTSDTPKKKGFMLKFQCQNRKKPFEVSFGKDKMLQLAMVKCAEHLEIPIANLMFEFDGETIQGNTTPSDLDLDSGDCIDVKIINVNK